MLDRIVEDNKTDTIIFYNADETGLTTVKGKPRRVLSRKGRSKICSVSSRENGVTTTAVCCVSAGGCYGPPIFIYRDADKSLALPTLRCIFVMVRILLLMLVLLYI
jgi:hypothetical protein